MRFVLRSLHAAQRSEAPSLHPGGLVNFSLAETGSLWAQKNLGLCYQAGEGVARDPAEAARWFRSSADGGNYLGQYHLGLCYLSGEGVERGQARLGSGFGLDLMGLVSCGTSP